MTKRTRDTLRNYFSEGALPSDEQFADLIDSSLNIIDEGFDRDIQHGIKISLLGSSEQLLSFFQDPEVTGQPVCSVQYDKRNNTLVFFRPNDIAGQETTLTLGSHGRIGINTPHPEHTLDVNGVIAAKGRIGVNPDGRLSVPANGQWQDITETLTGCHAFEVMAGVGSKGTGRYALLHAIAMNTYNPNGWLFNFLNLKKRIRCTQAYYLSRSCRLKIRWVKQAKQGYRLQLATNTAYGEDIHIQYRLTQLWFDESMSESQPSLNLSELDDNG